MLKSKKLEKEAKQRDKKRCIEVVVRRNCKVKVNIEEFDATVKMKREFEIS
jgi:hypothetical protein